MAYNKKEALQANTEAIRVVLRLEKERREATEAEKSILRDYQGFGGLKCVLNRTDNPDDIRYWSKSEQNLFEPTQQLKQMIYREALDANTAKRYWESIKASVLTSFYTDTRIVTAIADALTSVNVPHTSMFGSFGWHGCLCRDLCKASWSCRCNGKGPAYCPHQPSPAPVWERQHLHSKRAF